MIDPTEKDIGFLCAFECGPMVAYLLNGCNGNELRMRYMQWVAKRVEAACFHIEESSGVDAECDTLERLSVLSYHAQAVIIDPARRLENLQSAMRILEILLSEGGGQ